MNRAIKGRPRPYASWELVQGSYKTFPTDHIDQVEFNNSTMLSNKFITAQSFAEDQILKPFILWNRFLIFVLKEKSNNFLKSGNQAVNINYTSSRADTNMNMNISD